MLSLSPGICKKITVVWIVVMALKRPYTFVVLALLIAIFGSLAALRTPTDISGKRKRSPPPRRFSRAPRAFVPSCLVFDVSLPGLNGLNLQKRLAGRNDMPIILISGYGDVPMTVQAMKAGAVESLMKPFSDEALLNAIRQAIDRSRAALGEEKETKALRERYASLSRREHEVMALVVTGKLNKQVGYDTALDVVDDGIEPHTVETLEVPNVGAPDVACIPDITVEPLP